MKLRTFVLMKSHMKMKMGHVKSKTRSLGQILQKFCVCSREQIFGLIQMELVASMKHCTFLKMGHIGSKTRSLGQIIENPMLVTKGLRFRSLL